MESETALGQMASQDEQVVPAAAALVKFMYAETAQQEMSKQNCTIWNCVMYFFHHKSIFKMAHR